MKTLIAIALLFLGLSSLSAADPAPPATITVEVQGKVRKPMKLTLPAGSNFTLALAHCGGFTDHAVLESIFVTSFSADGTKKTIQKVDVRREKPFPDVALKEGRVMAGRKKGRFPNVILKDGDIVTVPGSPPTAVPSR